MPIIFDENRKIFHLISLDTSYIFRVLDGGEVEHLYFGAKLPVDLNQVCFEMSGEPAAFSPEYRDGLSLDTLNQEYPSCLSGDFREPAYELLCEDGSAMSSLKYQSHEIIGGKPGLQGLPATYVDSDTDAETLFLVLADEPLGLEVTLIYSVFVGHNAIVRSVKFANKSNRNISLLRALSFNLDLHRPGFRLLHLAGAWARETGVIIEELAAGIKSIQSKRGASSHQHNPFVALLAEGADEDNGSVYGFSLVYSGNFIAQAELDQFEKTRVQMGINPFGFSWLLEPGEVFQTPEAVMVYSHNGLGEMSRTFHRLFRKNLCSRQHRDKPRPILANSWEAMYYDFTSDDIVEFAKSAKDIGIELIVVDDGWFGTRDKNLLARDVPSSSLGDWTVNREKIPEGIKGLAERVLAQGVKFGIWFEPEMVSPDSELFRNHPDWCIHIKGRQKYLSRGQHVLDLSRKDVCSYLVDAVSQILDCGLISYVKWDMNRNMTNIGSAELPASRQGETAHRYMLGLYGVLDQLTKRFPDVLFEGCSGGGGRFDPGILHYMPQIWTSDNTDAVSRISIQTGTGIVYPAIAMGCHVSGVPNHQTGRVTPLKFRGDVAMMGNLGYELDARKLSEADKKDITGQIEFYKNIRNTVQFGDMYRLETWGVSGFQYVSADEKEIVVFMYSEGVKANFPSGNLRLKSLSPDLKYELVGAGRIYSGYELAMLGLPTSNLRMEYGSDVKHLILVD